MRPSHKRLVDYQIYKSLLKEQERYRAKIILFWTFLEKTSDFMFLFEETNHKSVRIYHHKLKTVLKQ